MSEKGCLILLKKWKSKQNHTKHLFIEREAVKNSNNYDNSDIKSYVKDIENDNIELESMLLDGPYKDNIFDSSPKSNNRGV